MLFINGALLSVNTYFWHKIKITSMLVIKEFVKAAFQNPPSLHQQLSLLNGWDSQQVTRPLLHLLPSVIFFCAFKFENQKPKMNVKAIIQGIMSCNMHRMPIETSQIWFAEVTKYCLFETKFMWWVKKILWSRKIITEEYSKKHMMSF